MKFQYEYDADLGPVIYLLINNTRYGICFCHRKKERCIWFFGLEKYLCARCLGIWIGAIIGVFTAFVTDISVIVASISLLPLIVDGFTQLLRVRTSNNILRLLTGLLFGFGLISMMKTVIVFLSPLHP